MSTWWYSFCFLLLGILSFFTGEIVTFIMLAFIFIVLNNINANLKKYLKSNNRDDQTTK